MTKTNLRVTDEELAIIKEALKRAYESESSMTVSYAAVELYDLANERAKKAKEMDSLLSMIRSK